MWKAFKNFCRKAGTEGLRIIGLSTPVVATIATACISSVALAPVLIPSLIALGISSLVGVSFYSLGISIESDRTKSLVAKAANKAAHLEEENKAKRAILANTVQELGETKNELKNAKQHEEEQLLTIENLEIQNKKLADDLRNKVRDEEEGKIIINYLKGEHKNLINEVKDKEHYNEALAKLNVYLIDEKKNSINGLKSKEKEIDAMRENQKSQKPPVAKKNIIKIKGKEEFKEIVLTGEKGDCAFHAVLGSVVDKFCECENVHDRRENMAELIRKKLENQRPVLKKCGVQKKNENGEDRYEQELAHWIQKGIEDTIADGSRLKKFKGKVNELEKLKKAYDKFQNLPTRERRRRPFNWVERFSYKMLEEYTHLLAIPGVDIFEQELGIIACIYDVSIIFYDTDRTKSKEELMNTVIFNPDGANTVSVRHNGVNHYERLLDVPEMNNVVNIENIRGVRGGGTPPKNDEFLDINSVANWENLIKQQIKQYDYDAAEQLCLEAIEQFPDCLSFWLSLGTCQSNQEKTEEFIKTLQKITQLIPEDPRYWDKLVRCQYAAGHNTQAIKSYAAYLKILGDSYVAEEQYIEAEQVYKTAIDIDSENIEYWHPLWKDQNNSEKIDEVIKTLQKITQLRSDNPKYWDMLVGFQYAAGHNKQASKSYAAYLKRLGDSYVEEEKYVEAEQVYKTAVDIDSKNNEYLHALGAVQYQLKDHQNASAADLLHWAKCWMAFSNQGKNQKAEDNLDQWWSLKNIQEPKK